MHSNGQSVRSLATKPNTRHLTFYSLGILLTIVFKSPRCVILNVNEGLDLDVNYISKKAR
jgi:hypothetical protein